MSTNPNKPAFPTPHYTERETGEFIFGEPGCSKRELFSALALMGILANSESEPEDVIHNQIVAVRNADGLIKQLNEKVSG